jgi:hypothetical protein
MRKWYVASLCKECEKELTVHQCAYNECCLYCGYISGGCYWKNIVVRRIAPWWKFWDKRIEIKK